MKEKSLTSIFGGVIVLVWIATLGFWVGILWVIFHFASKYW